MIEDPHGVKGDWNTNLTGKWGVVAACFAAAWQYYYGDMEGLCRPHQNEWYNVRLDLEIEDKNAEKASGQNFIVAFLAQSIKIWLKDENSYSSSNFLFSVTIHELAHNAHYQNFETRHILIPRDFEFINYISSDLKETFAMGVMWREHSKRYPTAEPPFSYFKENGVRYTGLIEDLVDKDISYAQRPYLRYDFVEGFTMKQIENCLFKSFTYSEFTNKLKTTYPSGSSSGLKYTITDYDNLCNYWGNL